MNLRGDNQQRNEIKSELGHRPNLLDQLGYIVPGGHRRDEPVPSILLILLIQVGRTERQRHNTTGLISSVYRLARLYRVHLARLSSASDWFSAAFLYSVHGRIVTKEPALSPIPHSFSKRTMFSVRGLASTENIT